MAVRMKQTAAGVFKLFTDIRLSEEPPCFELWKGLLLFWYRPTGSERQEQRSLFFPCFLAPLHPQQAHLPRLRRIK